MPAPTPVLTITQAAKKFAGETGLKLTYHNLYRRMVRRSDCPVKLRYCPSARLRQPVAAIAEADYPVLRDWLKDLM
jgi:hypothetical protein